VVSQNNLKRFRRVEINVVRDRSGVGISICIIYIEAPFRLVAKKWVMLRISSFEQMCGCVGMSIDTVFINGFEIAPPLFLVGGCQRLSRYP
jgi:hypothetical protein